MLGYSLESPRWDDSNRGDSNEYYNMFSWWNKKTISVYPLIWSLWSWLVWSLTAQSALLRSCRVGSEVKRAYLYLQGLTVVFLYCPFAEAHYSATASVDVVVVVVVAAAAVPVLAFVVAVTTDDVAEVAAGDPELPVEAFQWWCELFPGDGTGPASTVLVELTVDAAVAGPVAFLETLTPQQSGFHLPAQVHLSFGSVLAVLAVPEPRFPASVRPQLV